MTKKRSQKFIFTKFKKYKTKRTERELYQIPDYIEQIGVGELRKVYLEKEESMKLKQKIREKVRPKEVGCIDYETLYNAFFHEPELKKCYLTSFGDVYFDEKCQKLEGTPFQLSDTLRNALGIGKDDLPPWNEAMKKYGYPPSYVKILNMFHK